MLRKAGAFLRNMTSWISRIIIMTELGQLMHSFDASKVVGNVVVRQVKDGEIMLALDSKEYTLTSKDIVIADSEKVLAIVSYRRNEFRSE